MTGEIKSNSQSSSLWNDLDIYYEKHPYFSYETSYLIQVFAGIKSVVAVGFKMNGKCSSFDVFSPEFTVAATR